MPTYEYLCPEGHTFEKFERITEAKSRARCPECGRMAGRRISGGAGLLFKGSGFYITDYGKDGKGPRKSEKESSETKPAEGRASKPESSESSESSKSSKSSKSEPRKAPDSKKAAE